MYRGWPGSSIARHAPDAVLIVVTNPLEVIAMVVPRETGFALRKVMGMPEVLHILRVGGGR